MGWMASEYPVEGGGERFEEHRRLVAEMAEYAVRAIEEGKADGSIRPDIDTPLLEIHLWGSMVGMLMVQANAREFARRAPVDVDYSTVVSSFVSVLMDAIRGEPMSHARISTRPPSADPPDEDSS
jgi:hypothetical protein